MSTTKRERLPRKCECGGKMAYAFQFGRTFSSCLKCTPTIKVTLPRKVG